MDALAANTLTVDRTARRHSRARRARVLNAIDRSSPARAAIVLIFFFSDMLNSKSEADLERRKISVDRIPQLIPKENRRRLPPGPIVGGIVLADDEVITPDAAG